MPDYDHVAEIKGHWTSRREIDGYHQATLKIGVQGLDVGPAYPSPEEAEWMRSMLALALAAIFVEGTELLARKYDADVAAGPDARLSLELAFLVVANERRKSDGRLGS